MEYHDHSEKLSTHWIENLAIEELNMDETGIVNMDDHLDPSVMLEESSINFMTALRDRFEVYTTKFNQFRGGAQSSSQVKVFKISNTVNDFMLFRNSMRLVVARKTNDHITIGFLTASGEVFPARISAHTTSTSNVPHEIRAHIGAFNTISWRFNGEIVELDSLVRHYLSEFIKNSAR